MKFTVAKNELERAMSRIDTIVPGRDMQTLLSNVLISIDDDKINITASDMESTVRIQLAASETQSGELIVRAKKISEIAKQLVSNDLIFSAEERVDEAQVDDPDNPESFIVKVQGSGGQAAKFTLTGSDRTHFPNISQIPEGQLSEIPSELLAEMINKAFYSISQEDNRYIYNGLCFQAEGNKLTIIGTDGRRLAAVTRQLPAAIELGSEDSGDIVVHAKAIRELQKIIDVSHQINIGVEQRDIFFQIGDAELSSRLLEGKFPDYNKVIPKEFSINFEVDREQLLNAFRQVMVMTEPPSFQIRLILEKNNLILKANTPDIGEAEIQISIDYSADKLEIGFNATYFTDILRNIHCSRVKLLFNDASKPVVIHDLDDPDFIALVMPMKI